MKPAKRLLILVMMLLPALCSGRQAYAQEPAGIVLENVGASVDFGEQITFVATIKSALPIRDASILILDEVQGVTHVEPLVVHEDGRTEYRFDTRHHELRPFSPLSWSYRVALADGSFQNSDVFTTRYEDTRFNWQSIGADMLQVHWYDGDSDFGQAALHAAQLGLDQVSRLIPADLNRPVEFYIYSSLGDLRGTLIPGSQEWIAGHADPSLGVVMVAIEPGPQQTATLQQRIPHELMHVILQQAVGEGYRHIPAWLSEGTASLAEVAPIAAYDQVLKDAVTRRDWIPLNSLCSIFPDDTNRALLAYAEARSFASYLYETYGSSGLFKLASAYAGGADCERGPELAFGVALSRLEEDWHASLAGQDPLLPALQTFTPYLVLLCVILIIPAISIIATMIGRRSSNEPETHIRK